MDPGSQYSGMSPEFARRRADVLSRVRAYFARHKVLEVDTPLLGQAASTDCHIDLFEALSQGSAPGASRYLQTSPELHMKRLLARGFGDIYQVCHVCRAGESGGRHNPEFTMLEWYRVGFSMEQLIDEVAGVCRAVLGKRDVTTVAYADLFRESTGLDPLATDLEELREYIRTRDPDAPTPDCSADGLQYFYWVPLPPLQEGSVELRLFEGDKKLPKLTRYVTFP